MRRSLLIGAASAIVLLPQAASAQRLVVVERSGRVSWEQMVRAQAEKDLLPEAARPFESVPFLPTYVVREIGTPGDERIARIGQSLRGVGAGAAACPPEPMRLELRENFLALADNSTRIPPDTMGAVGRRHLVTMLNTEVGIQSRSGGELSRVDLSTFWTSGTGLVGNPFDPVLLYDPMSERWIATTDSNQRSSNSGVFFAISDTDDPTGMWSFYQFTADVFGVHWSDFPGLGVNSTWIAITNNMFRVSDDTFNGVKMWVIDKASALAGGPLTVTIFDTDFDLAGGFTGATLRPCLTFDAAEPDLYIVDVSGLVRFGLPLIRLSRLSGTGSAPIWSSLPGELSDGTGHYSSGVDFSHFQVDADQMGTTVQVDTNDSRVLNAVMRNGRIWCTNTGGFPSTGTVDRTGVIWYEFDPLLPSPLIQSGFIEDGPDSHCFYPSISVNCQNDVCIGFSRSDPTRFIEAVFTGRLSTDPPGTTRPITLIKLGEDSYEKNFTGRVRWGDYSATVVDPIDDRSFWTIQEYAATDLGPSQLDDQWGTWWARIGPIRFCTGDSNADGLVDFDDIVTTLSNWQLNYGTGTGPGDSDGSGIVNFDDILTTLAHWSQGCPLPNDQLADATPIIEEVISFNTAGATTDGPADCAGMQKDLWYCYVSRCAGDATISLCGSTFDTALAVYDGCDNANTLLACSDDFCSVQSEVTLTVANGQQLLVRVGGKNGASGEGTLTISCSSNDSCATPTMVGLGSFPFSTLDATTDGPPPPPLCGSSGAGTFEKDIWFLFTPQTSGTLTAFTCNQADFDTRLAAYTGDCGSLTLIACNDDGPFCAGFTSVMNVPVTAGVPVRIRVGGFGLNSGTGTLTLEK